MFEHMAYMFRKLLLAFTKKRPGKTARKTNSSAKNFRWEPIIFRQYCWEKSFHTVSFVKRGVFQYLHLQKGILQIEETSLRSNAGIAINLWAKNMLWCLFLPHIHTRLRLHPSCNPPFITAVATLQPCPCYCTLSPCWLNKLLLDVWGPSTPAINLFTFN